MAGIKLVLLLLCFSHLVPKEVLLSTADGPKKAVGPNANSAKIVVVPIRGSAKKVAVPKADSAKEVEVQNANPENKVVVHTENTPEVTNKPQKEFGSQEEKFLVKHTYTQGSSYDFLTGDAKMAEKYLLEMNFRLPNGEILPPKKYLLGGHNGVKEINKKQLTIMDTDTKALQDDIFGTKDFQLWIKNPKKKINILTTGEYTLTHLTYQFDVTSQKLAIYGHQYKSKVVLGPNTLALPIHFEKVENLKTAIRSTKIAEFEKEKLLSYADASTELWKHFKAGSKREVIVSSNFYEKVEELKSKHKLSISPICRSTRSTGSSCAVIKNFFNEVVKIDSKTSYKVYQSASEVEKQHLAEIIRSNLPMLDDSTDAMKVRDLVKYEDFKTHVSKSKSTESLQNIFSTTFQANVDHSKTHFQSLENFEKIVIELGADVKISPSVASKAISNVAKSEKPKPSKVSIGVAVTSMAYGAFSLGRTLATGIIHNDKTSLAIVGSRVGYEVLTSGGVAVGTKVFQKATSMGKAVKRVGKIAGPVGDVADIGLSYWSLVTSIEALTHSENVYDKYGAVASIISNSVDLVVTASVAVLSASIPILAPVFVGVGLVIDMVNQLTLALFQAGMAVAKIDAEVPLHSSEKHQVFANHFLDLFGNRKPNYIDYLVAQKQANDLVVQNAVNFLRNHAEFLGVVFPSQTVVADGKCTLKRQHCRARMAGTYCLSGQRESWKEIGHNCELNRPCGNSKKICNKHTEDLPKRGRDYYECDCGGDTKMVFDTPKLDSLVDFRNTQKVYWERAVPEDVENAEFQCKPGSKTMIDFRVSQDVSKEDYLCENAIGVLQPKYRQTAGQIMLFDLKDGHDQVYLSQNSRDPPNMFLMGNDGKKRFEGSAAGNSFVFNSRCSGKLSGYIKGGSGYDSVTLNESCHWGKVVEVNLNKGYIRTEEQNLWLDLYSVEEFNGRKNQPDIVYLDCRTRKIDTQGGNTNNIDKIVVSRGHENYYCNLTILTSPFSSVKVEASVGVINIVILENLEKVKLDLLMRQQDYLKNNVLFNRTSSSEIIQYYKSTNSKQTILLDLYDSSGKAEFTFRFVPNADKNAVLYFTETHSKAPQSALYVSFENDPIFFHSLPELWEDSSRTGSRAIKNIFDIVGQNWHVVGGDQNDEFILHTINYKKLDGKKGQDTIKFHPSYNYTTELLLTNQQHESIERVVGLPHVPLTVYTACDTEFIATRGGLRNKPDKVVVEYETCKQVAKQLDVIMTGKTELYYAPKVLQKIPMSVFVQQTNMEELHASLTVLTDNTDTVLVNVVVLDEKWYPTSSECSQNSIRFKTWNKENDDVIFHFINARASEISNWTMPRIQFAVINELPGLMVLDRSICKPKVYYDLPGHNDFKGSNIVHGLAGFENIFRISTSSKGFEIHGGFQNNIVLLSPSFQDNGTYKIKGGTFGNNTLILQTSPKDNTIKGKDLPFLVNLNKGRIGFANKSSEPVGTVSQIHHVLGRQAKPDEIHAGCDTKSIDGRGGADIRNSDTVVINETNMWGDKCKRNLLMVVEKFTKIENFARTGNFVYQVNDVLTSSFNLLSTTTNQHVLQFSFSLIEILSSVHFDTASKHIFLRLSDGKSNRLEAFQMTKQNPTEQYSNPIFEFTTKNNSVSAQLLVESDGTTVGIILVNELRYSVIKSLPVHNNKFLLNVTTSSKISRGIILGRTTPENTNEFHLLNLATPLSFLNAGFCVRSKCNNLLFLENIWANKIVEVDMHITDGSVTTNGNQILIKRLQGITDLHGYQNTTSLVACETRQVTGVGKIVVKPQDCALNVIVEVLNYTEVIFSTDVSKQEKTILGKTGTINYRFAHPTSFDPSGNFEAKQNYVHNYLLPIKLDEISSIQFDQNTETLIYTINETAFRHRMISLPDVIQEMYLEPRILTRDNFRIQVSRLGEIFVIWGNKNSTHYFPNSSKLHQTANKLRVNIIAETNKDFYYIGYAKSDDSEDRDILQNVENLNSHLMANGAKDTIFEIFGLNSDVYVNTGFTDENFETWSLDREEKKQTIILTHVVKPIRTQTNTKYVPNVKESDDMLVIEMQNHENVYPGKIFILNGTKPCVSQRLQLLLSNSVMDLAPLEKSSDHHKKLARRRRSIDSGWIIRPRPLIISDDINIYNVAPDDLEDGQEILLDSDFTQTNSTNQNMSFVAAQDGKNLHITNLVNPGDMGVKTVVVSNFFKPAEKEMLNISAENFTSNLSAPATIQEVHVSLPGVSAILNETEVLKFNENYNELNETMEIVSIYSVYHQAEENILKNTPEVRRMFREKIIILPWVIYFAASVFVIVCVLTGTILYMLNNVRQNNKRKNYSICKNKRLQNEAHAVELKALQGAQDRDN